MLLPLTLQCYKVEVSCSTFTNSRTELAVFDSTMLGRMGVVDEIPCVSAVTVLVFLGELSTAPPNRLNSWVSTKVLMCPEQC